MSRLYVAGPLFTDAERAWNARLAAELRTALPGWIVDLPQDFCPHTTAGAGTPDYGAIFTACVSHLDQARAVLAILDGADADSGTSWECGYAHAKGIPVVGLRTDWRPAEDGTANCMLSRSCRAVVTSPAAAIQTLIRLGH